jgi:hypothetical protein
MRSGKRLVQIEVHEVGAEVAWPRDTNQRVHVGAVHVQLGAFRVQDTGDARYMFFKDAECVGIGQHQRGDISVDSAREFVDVDHTLLVRLDVLDRADARYLFVYTRIVLPGAGAERVEAEIDGVVLRGKARD